MHIYSKCRSGAVVSETLRALGNALAPADRTLAATLCYAVERRLSLWERLRAMYMQPAPEKFSQAAQDAVLVGAAGLMSLKKFAPPVLISSLIDWTKKYDYRGSRVVNAVLRRVLEQAPDEIERLKRSKRLDALCLTSGFPYWAAVSLCERYGEERGRSLVSLTSGSAAMSLRLSPDAPRTLLDEMAKAGVTAHESPLPECLRLDGTHLPTALPGYAKGLITPQTESSVSVGNEAADFDGKLLLDMCAGRGVKTGQIAQLRPDIRIEAWDLSPARVAAAEREMSRLGVENVAFRAGDALTLAPLCAPDAVLVDAPCSGSGTWRRHPEGKWRPQDALAPMTELQKNLLSRALSLVKRGGKVVYSTCSLFPEENEDVVSSVLADFPRVEEISPGETAGFTPLAHGYASSPDSPWTDGFYIAVFVKG